MTRHASIAAVFAAALLLSGCSGMFPASGSHEFLPLCPAHNTEAPHPS